MTEPAFLESVAVSTPPKPQAIAISSGIIGPPGPEGPPGPPGEPPDPLPPQVDTFATPGSFTWTKPAGAIYHDFIVCGAGGGGGSGMRGAAGTIRCGGGGGGSGVRNIWLGIPSSELPDTLPVGVLAGGVGGAASAADDTAGGAGGGSSATYSNIGEYQARCGNAGAGGTATSGVGGGGSIGANGGGSANTGGALGGMGNYTNSFHPFGGSSGGGISAANVASAGANAYVRAEFGGGTLMGGTGGTTGGAGRTNPNVYPDVPLPAGTGGSGGGGGSGGAGGAGGDGVLGGGGAGGGASVNGFPSGAGGKGGDGYVQVVSYFGVGPKGDIGPAGPDGPPGSPGADGTPPVATVDSATVDFSGDGMVSTPLSADVKAGSVGITANDTTTIDFTGDGTSASPLTADVKPGAVLTAVGDTATVDLTNTAGTVTADVKPGAVLIGVADTAEVDLTNNAGTVSGLLTGTVNRDLAVSNHNLYVTGVAGSTGDAYVQSRIFLGRTDVSLGVWDSNLRFQRIVNAKQVVVTQIIVDEYALLYWDFNVSNASQGSFYVTLDTTTGLPSMRLADKNSVVRPVPFATFAGTVSVVNANGTASSGTGVINFPTSGGNRFTVAPVVVATVMGSTLHVAQIGAITPTSATIWVREVNSTTGTFTLTCQVIAIQMTPTSASG